MIFLLRPPLNKGYQIILPGQHKQKYNPEANLTVRFECSEKPLGVLFIM